MYTKVDQEKHASFIEVFASSAIEWIVVMQFEMSSMEIRSGSQLIFRLCIRLLETSVFSKSNTRQMVQLTCIRRVMCRWFVPGEGIDHGSMFFQRVRCDSNHLILVIVVRFVFEFFQWDVLTIFLNGKQDNEINMDQPIGFMTKENERKSVLSQTFHIISQASNRLGSGTLGTLNSPRKVF